MEIEDAIDTPEESGRNKGKAIVIQDLEEGKEEN